MSTFALARLQMELWLARKLGNPALFSGVTGDKQRRERVREAIIAQGLEHHVAGRRKGQAETYGACFARIYGEPLRKQNKTEAAWLKTPCSATSSAGAGAGCGIAFGSSQPENKHEHELYASRQ